MEQTVRKKHPIRKALCIALCAALLYCAVSMLASAVVFRAIYPRRDGLSPFRYSYAELNPDCPREAFTFPSGSNMLSGWRYNAESPKGMIVIVNGIGDGADAHLPEIAAFIHAGWSVATWDATGVGKSEGRGVIGLQQIADDLAAFIAYLESSDAWDGLPIVLYGHSAGAYAAALHLNDSDRIRAAVCISGFDRPVALMYAHAKSRVGWFAAAQYPFLYLENLFLFGADADDSAREAIDTEKKPVLIFGGSSDDLVSYENSLIRDPMQYRNPNVICIEIDSEYRNEHSTLWLSIAAARYRLEHVDSEPIDKALANELDSEFMKSVLQFFEESIR